MEYEWVIGSYSGERAKSARALAESGTGYYIVDASGSGQGQQVIVAFKRACDRPRPYHLQPIVDPIKIQRYEKMRESR